MDMAMYSLESISTVVAAPIKQLDMTIKKVGSELKVHQNRLAHMKEESLFQEFFESDSTKKKTQKSTISASNIGSAHSGVASQYSPAPSVKSSVLAAPVDVDDNSSVSSNGKQR